MAAAGPGRDVRPSDDTRRPRQRVFPAAPPAGPRRGSGRARGRDVGGPRRGGDRAPARLPPRRRRTLARHRAAPAGRRAIPGGRVNELSPPRHRAGRAAAAAGPRRGVRLDAGGPWRGGGRPPARRRAIPAAASHGPVNRRTGPRRQTAPAAAADGTRRDIRPDTRRTAPRRKAVVRTCICLSIVYLLNNEIMRH